MEAHVRRLIKQEWDSRRYQFVVHPDTTWTPASLVAKLQESMPLCVVPVACGKAVAAVVTADWHLDHVADGVRRLVIGKTTDSSGRLKPWLVVFDRCPDSTLVGGAGAVVYTLLGALHLVLMPSRRRAVLAK